MISETSRRPKRSNLSTDQSSAEPRSVEMAEFAIWRNREIVLEDIEWIVKSKDKVIEKLSKKIENQGQII